jgi:hypothetical protein
MTLAILFIVQIVLTILAVKLRWMDGEPAANEILGDVVFCFFLWIFALPIHGYSVANKAITAHYIEKQHKINLPIVEKELKSGQENGLYS